MLSGKNCRETDKSAKWQCAMCGVGRMLKEISSNLSVVMDECSVSGKCCYSVKSDFRTVCGIF